MEELAVQDGELPTPGAAVGGARRLDRERAGRREEEKAKARPAAHGE